MTPEFEQSIIWMTVFGCAISFGLWLGSFWAGIFLLSAIRIIMWICPRRG